MSFFGSFYNMLGLQAQQSYGPAQSQGTYGSASQGSDFGSIFSSLMRQPSIGGYGAPRSFGRSSYSQFQGYGANAYEPAFQGFPGMGGGVGNAQGFPGRGQGLALGHATAPGFINRFSPASGYGDAFPSQNNFFFISGPYGMPGAPSQTAPQLPPMTSPGPTTTGSMTPTTGAVTDNHTHTGTTTPATSTTAVGAVGPSGKPLGTVEYHPVGGAVQVSHLDMHSPDGKKYEISASGAYNALVQSGNVNPQQYGFKAPAVDTFGQSGKPTATVEYHPTSATVTASHLDAHTADGQKFEINANQTFQALQNGGFVQTAAPAVATPNPFTGNMFVGIFQIPMLPKNFPMMSLFPPGAMPARSPASLIPSVMAPPAPQIPTIQPPTQTTAAINPELLPHTH